MSLSINNQNNGAHSNTNHLFYTPMMHLTVSVIIPCFNNAQFVGATLQSVLTQTYPNIEIIVIDDGSTDDSLEIIRSYNGIYWETGPNRGAPATRNRGLTVARGEFIKFLDADDVLLPGSIEQQVAQAALLPANQKAIVYGDASWIDQTGAPLSGYPVRPRTLGEDAIAHILTQNPLTSCPLHRRPYLLEIGGFDTALPRGQEYDLHLRLVLAGVEFIHHPGPVYQYREHRGAHRISSQGYSRRGPLVYYEILHKQRRAIETATRQPLTPAVRCILARRFWIYGRGVLREGYPTEANRYFQAARQLDAQHCVVGNTPYPTLVKFLGPQYAEVAIAKLRGKVGG